jgi:hypothetical protein
MSGAIRDADYDTGMLNCAARITQQRARDSNAWLLELSQQPFAPSVACHVNIVVQEQQVRGARLGRRHIIHF